MTYPHNDELEPRPILDRREDEYVMGTPRRPHLHIDKIEGLSGTVLGCTGPDCAEGHPLAPRRGDQVSERCKMTLTSADVVSSNVVLRGLIEEFGREVIVDKMNALGVGEANVLQALDVEGGEK